MKNLILIVTFVIYSASSFGQVLGNANYIQPWKGGQQSINLNQGLMPMPHIQEHEVNLKVKGIYNAKPDAYIAIFSLTQFSKTVEEADELLNSRIGNIKIELATFENEIELYIDVISFIPIYEYAVEKKIFSKKTYNEIPKGFEQKKNLHIKFSDIAYLDLIITACARYEIYDMVRVDYLVKGLETAKDSLRNKAMRTMNKKIGFNEKLTNKDFSEARKFMIDKFELYYPTERYQSYQAYAYSSILKKNGANVNQTQKSTTMNYVPIYFRDHDFIFHYDEVEPCVQIIYEVNLKIKIDPKPKEPQVKERIVNETEYFILTPDGNTRKLAL